MKPYGVKPQDLGRYGCRCCQPKFHRAQRKKAKCRARREAHLITSGYIIARIRRMGM